MPKRDERPKKTSPAHRKSETSEDRRRPSANRRKPPAAMPIVRDNSKAGQAAQARLRALERSRERTRQGSEIGDIPQPKNPRRRARALKDFTYFAVTYFPNSTGQWEFSPAHLRGNRRLQELAEHGGRTLEALPRGSGKTTRAEVFAIWCAARGSRKFIPIFGAESGKAHESIGSIKMELAENDLLCEDFPEICIPFRALENKPQRCASQTHAGELTHIEWTADTVTFPRITGSKASGAIISCHGILAASRGLKHKRPDGTVARPDLVILDDIQTDDSAKTPGQIRKRLNIVRKNILKLAGHGRTLAVVCNGTVIEKGDAMDQLLNDPSWQGVRVKAVLSWSKHHDDMWLGEYKRLRHTYDKEVEGDQLRARRAATEYYRANRQPMDEGCVVYWEHCYDRDEEISAIQHFYNALVDDGMEVFASEFQQEPLDNEKTANALKPKELKDRTIGVARGIVPKDCSMLTSFIDVQGKALYWGVVAWREGLGGHLVSYGTYPEQDRPYFTLREIPLSIQSITGIEDQAAVIHAGLEALVPQILDATFENDTKAATFTVSLLTIDANWRQYEGVVRDFCRRSRYGTRIMPSHGRHVGAAHRAMDDSSAKPGERAGPGWKTETKEMQRGLLHDGNFWKSMLAARLRAPIASPHAFTFHNGTHELLIDHLTAEYPQIITNETTGRKVEQWEPLPGRDNHWWDMLVGSMAAANYMGIEAVGASVKKVAIVRRKSPEELAAARERLMRLSGLN
jgi:hypothetical protein